MKNDTLFTKIAGGPEDRGIWITVPEFAIAADFKATLPIGVSLKGGTWYAKAEDGYTIGVIAGGRRDLPPAAECQAAARRALEAALAERGRLLLAELESLRRRAAERGIAVPPPSPTDSPAGGDTKEND